MSDPAPLPYETACTRIEEVIRRLDSGEAGLRETLELCQEGRRLVQFCGGGLDGARQRLGARRRAPGPRGAPPRRARRPARGRQPPERDGPGRLTERQVTPPARPAGAD